MVFSRQPLSLAITLALTFLVACGGAEPDSKLEAKPIPVSPKNTLSGIALDGYLKDAKVCIDLNHNLYCDREDGESVLTGEAGDYTLTNVVDNLADYFVIVEAIPNQTVDMDKPTEKILQAFVLSAPATHSALITPFTSLVTTIAEQRGTNFETAKHVLSQLLLVDAESLMSNYVAGQEREDKELHLLAQSLTRIMQAGEQVSVENGVTRIIARRGTRAKLGLLELGRLKSQTDKLVGINSPQAMDEIVREYVSSVQMSAAEIVNERVAIIPDAPKSGLVNDNSDTFSWNWIGHFTDVADYEYSLDSGESWQAANVMPLYVGVGAYEVGAVQVRLRADSGRARQAGQSLLSNKPFTRVLMPSAPASLILNDAINSFDWQYVPDYTEHILYEYSLDAGGTWQSVTAKPQRVDDIAIAKGAVQLRLAKGANFNSPAGHIISSITAFTITPARPLPPTIMTVNDLLDNFSWRPLVEFQSISDYEIYIGGTWRQAISNPEYVGNQDYPANTIKIRVSANDTNAMEAGVFAVISSAFTQDSGKPVAATNGVVDDINDSFDWDYVPGFETVDYYEISTDAGETWGGANTKPSLIQAGEFAVGQVCVRIVANAIGSHVAGGILCSEAAFTLKPVTPGAPSEPASDDVLDTFGWQWTSGFEQATDYEIKTPEQDWTGADANPHQLPADKTYQAGDVQVRVKGDTLTGRAPSLALVSLQAYTKTAEETAAPTIPVSDDVLDTFGWQWTSGFEQATDYEVKTPGQDWTGVNTNPYQLPIDNIYQAGEVQVRVKGDTLIGRAPSLALVSLQDYTVKPSRPNAPANPVQDDILNSFDWDLLVAFPHPSDYEFSINGGISWLRVSEKPLLLGNINLGAGLVQIRVKANPINGMSAGDALVNTLDFTAGVQADAPSSPEIINTNGVNITNGLKWSWAQGFTEAQSYEYSNDAGLSWTNVNSNPQHIGPQAYSKDKVQIRVRANAKEGEANPPGKVMDASSASGKFIAMEFVPMLAVDKVVTISESYNGSNQYRFDSHRVCWAQFDLNGEGEPIYWGDRDSYVNRSKLDEELTDLNSNSVCGISDWDAPPELLVMTSTAKTNTERKSVDMAQGSGAFWAKTAADYVIYQDGALVEAAWDTSYYPYWKLPETSEVMAQLLLIKHDLTTRVSAIKERGENLDIRLLAEMSKSDIVDINVVQLEQDIQTLDIASLGLRTELDEAYARYRRYVDMIHGNRPSTKSVSLTELESYLTELQLQQTDLNQVIARNLASMKATSALKYLLSLSTELDDLLNKISSINGKNGQELHRSALALYQSIYQLKQSITLFDSIYIKLTEAIDAGVLSDALNVEMNGLAARLNSSESSADVMSAETTAKQALARAKSDGYSVLEADAIIGTHYRKLDINGDYLPSNTHFSQGWRCVSDSRFANFSRVWTLLNDGLPRGDDNLPFDDGTNTEANVMGTSGRLKRFNDANYCARSDWKIPSLIQIKSLETLGGYSKTIDTDVFPHHLAMTDKYDTYSGGKRFFYWLIKADDNDDSKQQSFTFLTSNNYGSSKKFFDKSTSEIDENILISRFVSEISPFVLLDINGLETSVLTDAKCARDKVTGSYWQLFKEKGSSRFKHFNELAVIADEMNTISLCGVTTWGIPNFNEVNSLHPFDESIFINNDVSGNYNQNACYVSSDESTQGYSGKRKKCLKVDGSEGYVTYEGGYNMSPSLYRLHGK